MRICYPTISLTSAAGTDNQTVCINNAITNITYATTDAAGATFSDLPAGVTGSWAADVVTILGTPTESGTFNYTITTTGGCGTVETTGTITVNPENTVSAASSSPTPCINTLMTSITHTTTGATGINQDGVSGANGLPANVSATWAADTITISGSPSASGTFNYSIPLTGGCGSVNATGTITVVANNAVSAASSSPTLCINTALNPAITHTTTGATGINQDGVSGANGLPANVSATWAADTITISGSPSASGTFNYSIPLTGGCGSVNATGTITVTPDNTVSAASSSPTLCINTALNPAIIHTTTGATGINQDGVSGANGLPANVSATWAANTITISGSPSASGTFNYSIPLTGGCGTVNATGTITVNINTATLTSAAGTDSQTVYVNQPIINITYATTDATGIANNGVSGANGLPAGVAATWTASPDTITISGTPTAGGTFNYSIPLTGGCGTVNATGTITVLDTPLPTNDRQALKFDGDGDYVYVSDDSSLDLTATGTIEAWIFPTEFTPGAGIVTKGTPDMCYGFGLGGGANEQNISFYVFGTGGTEYSLTAAKTLEAFQWYHVACVWDSADSMNIYINGISEATSSSIADARTNIQNLRFGINEESVLNTPTYFQGVIDEVRIWNTARPLEVSGADNDIRDFMCKKLDGSEDGLAGYWRFDENNSIVVGDWAGNGNIGFVENATRICSQAPIGDDSAFCDYNAATFTVSLGFGSLDDMTVTEDGGTWDSSLDSCLHVYRVDSPPNFTTASLLWKPFNDALRYWGVFKAGGADPTYTMVYHYDGYPITGSENNLQMAYRRHNCEQWKGLNATLNTTTKTLTKEGLSGTEFILGADVDPRNTINYDGTNDYVEVSDENSLDLTTSGTLEAWIYPEDFATGAGIILKGTTDSTLNSACYGFGLGGGATVFTGGSNTNIDFIVGNSTGGVYRLNGTTNLIADKWYHVACAWEDAATDRMEIYLNGVQYAFSTANIDNAATVNTDAIRFGMDAISNPDIHFNGRIDEVRIWDVRRNQTQIQANMCQKIDTRDPNLVGYWRFDEETTSDTSFDFGTVPYNFATMYNFGTATGIITARVCSEAPIGDRSAYSYGSTASATVTHPDGDYFTATKFAGDWGTKFSGLHVYQVDGVPVYPPDISGPLPYNPYVTPNGLTPPYDFSTTPPSWSWSSIDYTRYWGVFTTDWATTNQPTYDVIYHYGTIGNGNPNVPDESDPSDPNDPQIGLAYRPTYCYGTWTDSTANWAFGTRQLELLGANSKQQSQNSPSKTNPEYVLGGKNQPLAISLASFNASVADGCIDIFWETATEVDTVGFQLWRSETKKGVYELVPYSYTRSTSVTETRGAAYAFTDCSVVLDGTTDYYYKLEEIDTDNAKENPFYGPIGPVKETVSASQGNTGKVSSGSSCFIGALQ